MQSKIPVLNPIQGRITRVTTLFRISLAACASLGFAPVKDHRLKSLRDVTVAPVAPTDLSAHRSQNELQQDITGALHQPALLLGFSPAYSFCSNTFYL